jgi:hypothetical protein
MVLSTYFTTKRDPQRNSHLNNDEFRYIEKWYSSIVHQGIHAIIFYDSLSDNFVRKYENEYVRFIKCKLGNFSINDERFFIYYEFLETVRNIKFVLCTDISDVVINKHPTELFETYPNKIFLGRDNISKWGYNLWNIKKIKLFKKKSGLRVNPSFFNFPVFNAGLIAGKYENIMCLLSRMIEVFILLNDSENHNMIVINWVIHNYYLPSEPSLINLLNFNLILRFYYSLNKGRLKKIRNLLNIEIDKVNENVISTTLIYSGFPFCSLYKKYESDSLAFINHK